MGPSRIQQEPSTSCLQSHGACPWLFLKNNSPVRSAPIMTSTTLGRFFWGSSPCVNRHIRFQVLSPAEGGWARSTHGTRRTSQVQWSGWRLTLAVTCDRERKRERGQWYWCRCYSSPRNACAPVMPNAAARYLDAIRRLYTSLNAGIWMDLRACTRHCDIYK